MSEGAVLLFITDHLQGMKAEKEKQLMSPLLKIGYKAKPGLHSLATVRRRLCSLTTHNKGWGYDDPCSSNKVKHLLYAMSRTGKKTIQHKAITNNIFEKLLTVCDGSVKGGHDMEGELLHAKGNKSLNV